MENIFNGLVEAICYKLYFNEIAHRQINIQFTCPIYFNVFGTNLRKSYHLSNFQISKMIQNAMETISKCFPFFYWL